MEVLSRALNRNLEALQPAITVGCVIHSAYTLTDGGMENVLTDLLLPGFINFFGPGLCANMIYKQSELSKTSLVSYFTGIIMFSIFSQIQILHSATAIFPVVAKGIMFVNLKNTHQPFHLIVGWLLALEASSALIYKLLFNKRKIDVGNDKLCEMFFLIFGLGLGRLYMLPDHTMMLMVFLSAMGSFVQYISSLIPYIGRKEQRTSEKTVRRTPRRKAAQKAKDTLKQRK